MKAKTSAFKLGFVPFQSKTEILAKAKNGTIPKKGMVVIMEMNKYIGHSYQISGVCEMILAKGKGKGMTFLEVRNGKGLSFKLSADRCMDISEMSFKGVNMGYFAPCGYVAPSFYDSKGAGFLKSFTAGFLTTCGLAAVGSPCIDDGEELPLHGNISNTPCDSFSYSETDDEIIINACVRDASLFGNQLLLHRKYICKKNENTIEIQDTIENIGPKISPCMILYHINIGYPLLSENAEVIIPHNSVTARDEHAKDDINNCLIMEKPQKDYCERCYYYDLKEKNDTTTATAAAAIYNRDVKKGLKICFDKNTLDYFTEWKMMGEYEYVLGLEPANCTPDGRDVMRKQNKLKFINSGEKYKTNIKLKFIECEDEIKCL